MASLEESYSSMRLTTPMARNAPEASGRGPFASSKNSAKTKPSAAARAEGRRPAQRPVHRQAIAFATQS